jgi:hypothetical protein
MVKLSVKEVYAEGSFCRKNDGPVRAVGRRAAGQPTHIAIYAHIYWLTGVL